MKRQLPDCEKIFANDATDKGLIKRKYANSSILRKSITQSKNGQESRIDISPKKKCHTDGQ